MGSRTAVFITLAGRYVKPGPSGLSVYKCQLLAPGGAYQVEILIVTNHEVRARHILEETIQNSDPYRGATIGSIKRVPAIVDRDSVRPEREDPPEWKSESRYHGDHREGTENTEEES